MGITNLQAWIEARPYAVGGAILLLSLLTFFVALALLARGLTYFAAAFQPEAMRAKQACICCLKTGIPFR